MSTMSRLTSTKLQAFFPEGSDNYWGGKKVSPSTTPYFCGYIIDKSLIRESYTRMKSSDLNIHRYYLLIALKGSNGYE
jgi:hypothetical protein